MKKCPDNCKNSKQEKMQKYENKENFKTNIKNSKIDK